MTLHLNGVYDVSAPFILGIIARIHVVEYDENDGKFWVKCEKPTNYPVRIIEEYWNRLFKIEDPSIYQFNYLKSLNYDGIPDKESGCTFKELCIHLVIDKILSYSDDKI